MNRFSYIAQCIIKVRLVQDWMSVWHNPNIKLLLVDTIKQTSVTAVLWYIRITIKRHT